MMNVIVHSEASKMDCSLHISWTDHVSNQRSPDFGNVKLTAFASPYRSNILEPSHIDCKRSLDAARTIGLEMTGQLDMLHIGGAQQASTEAVNC